MKILPCPKLRLRAVIKNKGLAVLSSTRTHDTCILFIETSTLPGTTKRAETCNALIASDAVHPWSVYCKCALMQKQ